VIDPVLQVVPLASQWPTIDPFLFCVHHDDAFPAGNAQMGPAAPLEGRDLGQDFSALDGWNMYHGRQVPGFPQHPHRGFETVTIVRHGLIDHSDSLGAAARFGSGDVQWLTAGGGIVHSEMFPLLDPDGPNPLELFQIWLNLPAEDKLVEPYFTMLWDGDIPRHVMVDDAGHSTEVTVIAGTLADHSPPPPPPNSWASRPDADVVIWIIRIDEGGTWELPPATGGNTVRVLYVFEGSSLEIADQVIPAPSAAVLRCDEAVTITGGEGGVECLMLQGRPIGEPVEQRGPFVMNDRAGLEQAFEDYRRTGFGGWPWPVDDPVHGSDQGRFARHADGTLEQIPVAQP